jgi:hypothetical protein
MGNVWDEKAAWPDFPPIPPVPEILRVAFEKVFGKPASELSAKERADGAHMYLAAYFGEENAMTPYLVGD